MTAGVLWLGLQLLGVKHVGLYDEVSSSYHMTFGVLTVICSRDVSHGLGMLCVLPVKSRNHHRSTKYILPTAKGVCYVCRYYFRASYLPRAIR